MLQKLAFRLISVNHYPWLIHQCRPVLAHLSLLCLGEPEAPVLLAADGDLQGSILVILIRSRALEDALLFLQVLPLDLQPRLLSRNLSLPKNENKSVPCQIAGPKGSVNDEEVQGKDQKKKELDVGVQQILWFTYETWYWKCLFTTHYLDRLSLFLSLHFT